MSKEPKEQSKNDSKKNSKEKTSSKKEGIERYLKSDVEIVDVTEEMMGQGMVWFGRPSKD